MLKNRQYVSKQNIKFIYIYNFFQIINIASYCMGLTRNSELPTLFYFIFNQIES